MMYANNFLQKKRSMAIYICFTLTVSKPEINQNVFLVYIVNNNDFNMESCRTKVTGFLSVMLELLLQLLPSY